MLLVVARRVEGASIALAWDPNTEIDLAGYVLWYGTTPGTYTVSTDVGKQTSYVATNLTEASSTTSRFRRTTPVD